MNMENSMNKTQDATRNIVEEVKEIVDVVNNLEKLSTPNEIIDTINNVIPKIDDLTIYNYDEAIKHEKELKTLQERSNQMGEEYKQKNLSVRLKIYEGKTVGKCVLRVLDMIIENNKEEEGKITVKFMGQETNVSDEINNMKQNVKDILDDYNIIYDYDENKCINRAVIEEIK